MVMSNGCTTVREKFFVAICCGLVVSVTVTVAVLVPAAAAVPVMTPVEGTIANPAGRFVACQLYGVVPPLALTAAV